jgi:hypothetical protein
MSKPFKILRTSATKPKPKSGPVDSSHVNLKGASPDSNIDATDQTNELKK